MIIDSGAANPTPPSGSMDPGARDWTAGDVFAVQEVPSWAQPFLTYIVKGELPEDEVLARQVVRRCKAYTIINGELYKRSVSGVFQRCVQREDGCDLPKDIHQGECGHHASSRAIAAKVLRHGFFWRTALADLEELIRKCKGC